LRIEIDNLDETYDKCLANGKFVEKNKVDVELIKSLRDVAERGLAFIEDKSKSIGRQSTDWTFVFRDYYESLRGLIEAVLLFDQIVAESHQCKNAYICSKHPEFRLDWEFLEIVRLKRNSINYRGRMVNYDEWSKLKAQFETHIKTLTRNIEERLENLK
jgi:hypothetical protein